MSGTALVLLVAVTAAASAGFAVALATRRRRSRPDEMLGSRYGRAPAGVKHLADTVSELSDLELHLPPRAPSGAGKARLGALLGLR